MSAHYNFLKVLKSFNDRMRAMVGENWVIASARKRISLMNNYKDFIYLNCILLLELDDAKKIKAIFTTN